MLKAPNGAEVKMLKINNITMKSNVCLQKTSFWALIYIPDYIR